MAFKFITTGFGTRNSDPDIRIATNTNGADSRVLVISMSERCANNARIKAGDRCNILFDDETETFAVRIADANGPRGPKVSQNGKRLTIKLLERAGVPVVQNPSELSVSEVTVGEIRFPAPKNMVFANAA